MGGCLASRGHECLCQGQLVAHCRLSPSLGPLAVYRQSAGFGYTRQSANVRAPLPEPVIRPVVALCARVKDLASKRSRVRT